MVKLTDWAALIGRGKHTNLLLFEITEQDLLETESLTIEYSVGNVLLFDETQTIGLGAELARADDLSCAIEFLGLSSEDLGLNNAGVGPGAEGVSPNAEGVGPSAEGVGQSAEELSLGNSAAVYSETPEKTAILELQLRIEQRDGLLSDLNEKLRHQRDEIDLLQLLLDQTQAQLALDAASRDELMDDLKQASANTMVIETNLEQVMEEKFMLEQELAEKITELIESSMTNDNLRRQLNGYREAPASKDQSYGDKLDGSPPEYQAGGSMGSGCPSVSPGGVTPVSAATADALSAQTLTMSSGKQIHIYHEFPSQPRRGLIQGLNNLGTALLKACALLLLAVAMTLVGSILATSLNNDISYGQALDLILRNVLTLASG